MPLGYAWPKGKMFTQKSTISTRECVFNPNDWKSVRLKNECMKNELTVKIEFEKESEELRAEKSSPVRAV